MEKGIEVKEVADLQPDDMLWVSSGESFFKDSGNHHNILINNNIFLCLNKFMITCMILVSIYIYYD